MITSTNSFLEIGSTHDDCQDFALAGTFVPKGSSENLAYAIVTDGCSASHNICREVDFGARLVSYSAKIALFNAFNKDEYVWPSPLTLDKPFSKVEISKLAGLIINKANDVRLSFRLHTCSIDSTAIICVSNGIRHNIVMYGDGGIVYKRKNEPLIHFMGVDFQSGAPFYLSYLVDSSRHMAYNSQFKQPVNLITTDSDNKSNQSFDLNINFDHEFYHSTSFSLEGDMDFIAVTSDGIKSFQQPHKDYPDIIQTKDVHQVLNQMFGYKNLNGQFVERRMKKFKLEMASQNVTHYDDISVAAISFGDHK